MSRNQFSTRKEHMTLAQWQEFVARMKDVSQRMADLYYQLQSHESLKESANMLPPLRSMHKARVKLCHMMAKEHGYDAADMLFWDSEGGWPGYF